MAVLSVCRSRSHLGLKLALPWKPRFSWHTRPLNMSIYRIYLDSLWYVSSSHHETIRTCKVLHAWRIGWIFRLDLRGLLVVVLNRQLRTTVTAAKATADIPKIEAMAQSKSFVAFVLFCVLKGLKVIELFPKGNVTCSKNYGGGCMEQDRHHLSCALWAAFCSIFYHNFRFMSHSTLETKRFSI